MKWFVAVGGRISQAGLAVLRFLYFNPKYAVLAFVISVVLYEVIFWSLNMGLGWFLFTSSQLSLGDKLDIVVGSYTDAFRLPLAWLGLMIVAVSLLQGIVVSALIYMIGVNRSANASSKRLVGGVGLAGGLSVLGLGCVPCGTSLVTPLLTLFFATSAPALAAEVGMYAVVGAFIITLVAVYVAGRQLARFSYSGH